MRSSVLALVLAAASARLWFVDYPSASINTVVFSAEEECSCVLFSVPVRIDDLDVVRAYQTQLNAGDVVEFGVYSLDGTTRFFRGQAPAVQDYVDVQNTIASPGPMGPAQVWFCAAIYDALGSINSGFLRLAPSSAVGEFAFSQPCPGGAMPAALTNPVPVYAEIVLVPWFSLEDR